MRRLDPSARWSRAAGLGLALALLGLAPGCGGPAPQERPGPRHPVLLIGVDGLEWGVMLPLIREGRMPTVARLMQQGTFGRLETLRPTLSPAIWTSMATGKVPAAHGIRNFVARDPKRNALRLFTNRDRRTKALWNIFSDYGRRVHSIGWWMTFPAEAVNGVMVAQTNTRAQLDTARGRAVWKGRLVPGLEGQVYPTGAQPEIMAIAREVNADLPRITRSIFGRFEHPHTVLSRRLWDNTRWAIRADATYARVARRLLADGQRFDLMLLYLGGPDVVGHRFWRYMRPKEYADRPSREAVENFSDVIGDYYGYVDSVIGAALEAVPGQASVLIVSDHGMRGVNHAQSFDPDAPPVDVNSAGHRDAPPGVMIAAGRYLRRGSSPPLDDLSAGDLPVLGSVLDMAPTLLALKGLPVGRDMDGVILDGLLEEELLQRYRPAFVETHDTRRWLAGRSEELVTSRMEQERIEQLRALGYLP